LTGELAVADNDDIAPENLAHRVRTPSGNGGNVMSDELRELIERFRGYRMSEEELREQAIDFAYGNGHFEDPRVTLEGVTRAADLDRQDENSTVPR
jgi:hypothetical protein